MKILDDRRNRLDSRFPTWPGLTLPGFFEQIAAEYPERPLVLTANQTLTYGQVRLVAREMASGLIAGGLAAGEHVAIIMANSPDFVIARLAIAYAGCVSVPINTMLQREEMRYVLNQSDATHILAMMQFRGRDYRDDLSDLSGPSSAIRRVVTDCGLRSRPNSLTFAELASAATPESDQGCDRRVRETSAQDLSDVIYTSGTTGRPKGVMLTHDMVLRAAYSSALTRNFEDGRRIQFALPLYHVFGYVECLVAAMFVGGAIIPHAQFDADEMLDWCRMFSGTDMVCVPMMTHRLIERARERGLPLPSLQAFFNSGGNNLDTVWRDIREALGVGEIHTAYGMTETTASSVCTRPEDGDTALLETNGRCKLAGAAGDPTIGGLVADYRVVDSETGAVLPFDQDGELQVRGPVVTQGYYRKPDETQAAVTDGGWFRTGDLGRILEGGHLRLTGRLKETYRCGGEMVMPRELEQLLEDYAGIEQVLVVGIPDARMGEVGCLCVVPEAGCAVNQDELIAYCASRLARFKVPRHVAVFAAGEIPMTVTGRPQRFKLAQMALERLVLAQKAD